MSSWWSQERVLQRAALPAGLVGGVALFDVLALMTSKNLRFHPLQGAAPLLVALMVMALALYYTLWRTDEGRIAQSMWQLLLVLVFTYDYGLLSYIVLSWRLPFADPLLYAADGLIGLRGGAIASWIEAYSGLSLALRVAYSAFSLQFACIIISLTLVLGRPALVWRWLSVCAVGATLGMGIYALLPGFGDYPVETPPTQELAQFVEQAHTLQATGGLDLAADHMTGVITFPSFHAFFAMAGLWACGSLPKGRWIAATLYLPMTIAAFNGGGHYTVDVLAAFPLVAASVLLVRGYERLMGLIDPTATPAR